MKGYKHKVNLVTASEKCFLLLFYCFSQGFSHKIFKFVLMFYGDSKCSLCHLMPVYWICNPRYHHSTFH